MKIRKKSDFSRNVLTLMTGTTVAQAIPLAISPILTRIYTPHDFGLLALFISISFIFGSIANAKYEQVIMLPKKDEDAINILALGFIISSTLTLILLFIVIFFNNYIATVLNNQEISSWLYFIPISVFFIALFNLLTYFNSRKKNYKDIARATIIKSLVMATVQLSIGFLKNGATGLISGQFLSQMFANMRLLKNIIKNRPLLSKIRGVKIIALAKKYRDFPKFALPSNLANTLSQHLTTILISSFYSVATLGFYSLAQRVLGMPSALVGNAIGQVFFQEATEERQRTGTIIKTFDATVKRLIVIALPSFTLLFFMVESLFSFVFGEEWSVAGEYAKILIPYFFISLISSTLSSTYDIFGYLKLELWWQISLLIGVVSIMLISNELEIDFKNQLIMIMGYTSIMQVISFIFMKKIIYKKGKK